MDILLNSTGITNLRTASGITTGTLYVRRDSTGDDLRVSANADMSAYTELQSNTEQVFAGAAYALGWGTVSVSSATNKYVVPVPVQPVYYAAGAGLSAGGVALPVSTVKTDPLTGVIRNSYPSGGSTSLGKIAAGTCALLGDSRNDQHSNGAITTGNIGRTKTATHWLIWYNALNNQPLIVTSKYAVSGSQTSALDGQITSMAALGQLPQFAFIWSGVNDIATAVTALTAFSNLQAACVRLLNLGVTPVVFLDPGATSLNTSAMLVQLFEYNERIRDMGESIRDILVFDPTATVWDPTAASWTATPAPAFKTGYSFDGTHLINLGGYALGVAFGAWFTNRIAPFEARSSCIGEMVNANNPLAYIANGLFTTVTGGAQSGTGALTGTVPASWTYAKGASAGTATIITTPSGSFGNDLTLVITTTGADTTKISQDVATGVKTGTAIGSILQAGYEVAVTAGTNLKGVNVAHEYNDGSTSYTYFDMYCQNTNAGNGPQAFTVQGQPNPMTIDTTPSGWITTRLEFVFSGAGGATVVVRRARLRKKFA